jgi:RHS repeat-associated protein
MAATNPSCSSTKYKSDGTDLTYYGFRYYNASTGKWLSRDPLREEGGANLFAVVNNDGINDFDPLGLITYEVKEFVPASGLSDEEPAETQDQTQFTMPGTKLCGFLYFGNNHYAANIHVRIAVGYKDEAAKKRKMASGVTVQQHEQAHVDVFKKKWANTEGAVNEFGKRCFCKQRCRELRDQLMDAIALVWADWAKMQNLGIEVRDYPESRKPRGGYSAAVSDYNSTRNDYTKLYGQFRAECD